MTQRLNSTFWLQKLSATSMFSELPARGFGGGGHHEIVKADGNQKFIAPVDKKMVAFTGLKGTTPAMIEVENPYRHHNDLSLIQ